jgi:hypothetical protein
MIAFLIDNLATILISVALMAVVALISAYLIRKKRGGQTSCGCGCAGCSAASLCHKD